jgi:hypothetical protein
MISIETELKNDRPLVDKYGKSSSSSYIEDSRLTVRVITRKLCVTLSVVHNILGNDLNMSKVAKDGSQDYYQIMTRHVVLSVLKRF